MKVKDWMQQNEQFAKELKLFAEFMHWKLEEIEELPMEVYLQLLMMQLMKDFKDFREGLHS
jgi:hypothetical protein